MKNSSEYNRQYYRANRQRIYLHRHANRLHRLANWRSRGIKLTLSEYDALVTSQGGRCAVCTVRPSNKRGLVVDHDHQTKQLRALLCDACNKALGLLQDSPALCKLAAQYLEDHRVAGTDFRV